MTDLQRDFNDLSKPMQRELDERIAAAGGDIASVRREVEARLVELNRGQAETEARGSQADRALLMIELRYLDAKARPAPSSETRGSWLNGLGASLRRRVSGGSAKNGGK